MKTIIAFFLCVSLFHVSANAEPCKAALQIVQLTQDNFREVLDSNCPVVIDVYADWCSPCRKFAPVFEKVHEQYKGQYLFVKLNGDEDRSLFQHFRVTAFPTILYLKNGKEVGRHLGYMDKKQFAEELKSYFKE